MDQEDRFGSDRRECGPSAGGGWQANAVNSGRCGDEGSALSAPSDLISLHLRFSLTLLVRESLNGGSQMGA